MNTVPAQHLKWWETDPESMSCRLSGFSLHARDGVDYAQWCDDCMWSDHSTNWWYYWQLVLLDFGVINDDQLVLLTIGTNLVVKYWILPLWRKMMINLFMLGLGHFFHVDRIVALREGVGAGMLEMAGKALEKLSVDTGAVAEFSVLDWWSLLHFNSR